MPSRPDSPPIELVTSDQQAAGPIMATMAVADQPPANNSRRGIRVGFAAKSRDRAPARSHGIEASHGANPCPAAPGQASPSVPPSAQTVPTVLTAPTVPIARGLPGRRRDLPGDKRFYPPKNFKDRVSFSVCCRPSRRLFQRFISEMVLIKKCFRLWHVTVG